MKKRLINTKFWSDGFIVGLKPIERYLFLYFLTNEHTELCGVYELPLEVIMRETGNDSSTIMNAFKSFKGKINYVDGWVKVNNFLKNQNVNENVKKGAKRSLEAIPSKILEKFNTSEPLPNASEPFMNHSEPLMNGSENLNLNLNLNLNSKERVVDKPPTPSQEASNFFNNFDYQEKIVSSISEKYKIDKLLLRSEVNKFIFYWTEPNKSGTKLKWQLQQTFDVKRRLMTWLNNVKNFNKIKNTYGKVNSD